GGPSSALATCPSGGGSSAPGRKARRGQSSEVGQNGLAPVSLTAASLPASFRWPYDYLQGAGHESVGECFTAPCDRLFCSVFDFCSFLPCMSASHLPFHRDWGGAIPALAESLCQPLGSGDLRREELSRRYARNTQFLHAGSGANGDSASGCALCARRLKTCRGIARPTSRSSQCSGDRGAAAGSGSI